MKIQLIHPPNDKQYSGKIDESKTHIPIGLEILAKSVENRHGDKYNIKILDGNHLSMNQILSKINIDSNIIGVTNLYSNTFNCLHILSVASSFAKTVMGGINATNDYKNLSQFEFIDHILRGSPEDIFPHLLEGINYNKKTLFNSNFDTIHDFSHSDISKYDKEQFIPISLKRGCSKVKESGRCGFCSIKDAEEFMKHPFEQIEVYKKNGFFNLRETGDDFNFNFYKNLFEQSEGRLNNINFQTYASPIQITIESIELMQKLNVKRIFLGIDSYNNPILNISNKGFTTENIDEAIKLIPKNIEIDMAIMLGFPGETKETLENNYRFFSEVRNKYNNVDFHVSKVLPLIGTGFYRNLMNSGVKEDSLIHDYKHLFKKQVELFTNLDLNTIDKYFNKMSSFSFGGFNY